MTTTQRCSSAQEFARVNGPNAYRSEIETRVLLAIEKRYNRFPQIVRFVSDSINRDGLFASGDQLISRDVSNALKRLSYAGRIMTYAGSNKWFVRGGAR